MADMEKRQRRAQNVNENETLGEELPSHWGPARASCQMFNLLLNDDLSKFKLSAVDIIVEDAISFTCKVLCSLVPN